MIPGANAAMILLVLTNLMLLGSSRLAAHVRLTAFHGFLVGILPLLVASERFSLELVGMAALAVAVKSVLFPLLMRRVMRDAQMGREAAPFVGYSLSLLLGVVALGVSLWLSARLPLPASRGGNLVLPAAFFSMFAGLILITTRRKAVTQALGYLVMENGIYAAGVAMVHGVPMLIELGVLLDVFVGVFLMGILIFHISREFDHIDTDQLATLKDWDADGRTP